MPHGINKGGAIRASRKRRGPQPILPSKLKAPVLNRVIARPRLLDLADVNGGGKRIVTIVAGPGFGKTTLLAQLRQSFPGATVWYQVDGLDHDPAVFLRHLITAVYEACLPKGERSLQRLQEAKNISHESESVIAVLLDEYNEMGAPALLVCFDDLHLINEVADLNKLLRFLIQSMHDSMTMVFASRAKPRISLARLRMKGFLREITKDELQFNSGETRALFVDSNGLSITPEFIDELNKKTEGWATGLVLLEEHLKHLKTDSQLPELFSKNKRIRRNVYEYLAEEVLSNQPAATRDLFMRSALIDPVDPVICKNALDVKNAATIFSASIEKNLFTTRVEGYNAYRFHPLFRDFLEQRFLEEEGADVVQATHIAFGEAFERSGQNKKAVEQYLTADERDRAICIIEKIGNNLIRNGEYHILQDWLEQYDDQLSPIGFLLKARCLMQKGKQREALMYLHIVEEEVIDEAIQYQSKIYTCEILSKMARFQEMITILSKLLNIVSDPDFKIRICFWLAVAHQNRLEIEKAKENLCLIEDLDKKKIFPYSKMISGALNLVSGDYQEAQKSFEDASTSKMLDMSSRVMMKNNIAYAMYMSADYSGAMQLSDECIAEMNEYHFNALFPQFLDTHGCILIASHRISEGRRDLETALRLTSSIEGTSWEKYGILSHLGTLERRLGNFDRALDFHKSILQSVENANRIELIVGQINVAADMLHMGLYDKASKYLDVARDLAQKKKFSFYLTQINYQSAWLALLQQDETRTSQYLAAALSTASKHQHNHFLIQEGKITLPLLSFAIRKEIDVDYVLDILSKIGAPVLGILNELIDHQDVLVRISIAEMIASLGDRKGTTILRKLLKDNSPEVRLKAKTSLNKCRNQMTSPSEVLSPREIEVLEALATGASNKKIGHDLFISEVTVKTHANRIFRKLGLTNRLQAALFYQEWLQKAKLQLPGEENTTKG